MSLLRPVTEPRVRVPRLVAGLVLCGLGVALMVAADLGLSPWAVLDQGISRHTDIPIGTVSIIVGALVLLAWMPLRERPGLGTVLNVLLIGVTIDLALLVLDTPEATGARVAYLALGLFLWGPGSGLYIGAGLGPGPRDGLMTGLSARGIGSIRVVRTAIEVTALGAGWLLGGSVGLGTLAFAITIGPNVQAFLPRLTVRRPAMATDGPGAARSDGPMRSEGARSDGPVLAEGAALSDGASARSDGPT
ncbi:MAG: hypothetical protein JXA83_10555, partial [Acidimicrobiales bacterium]|nr:hypothetical protein [Acidimicrobiales bacterium]